MLNYPNINPIALHIGPLSVHWYGLMYLIGFLIGWGLLIFRVKQSPRGFQTEQLSDIIFYTALGVIIGGRVGYMVFYQWHSFLINPLTLLQIWKGGMSFHGGLLGVLVALSIYAWRHKVFLGDVADLIAPVVPIGLGAGRIGNFINGELWGRATTLPWGMVFPQVDGTPRHPSQLYEFLLEGVVMFVILWWFSRKIRPRWAVSGLFLVLYSLFRFVIEFYREPDGQIGFVAFGWMTQGQLLSLPMFIVGVAMIAWAYFRGKKSCTNT